MIDFLKAQKSFKGYLKNFDLTDGSIKLKIKHTEEVINKSEYLAKALILDEKNIELAKIIALLHDIGRFEQIKQTKNFQDGIEFDHADYGVKILFKDNLIKEFCEDRKYDNLIRVAIYNHNKFEIEKGLNEQEILHCKIIRDADKLDNFRVKELEKFEDMFPGIYNSNTINYESISDKVYDDFMNCKCIKLKDRKTQIDYWICILAFIFDLNFKQSLQYIKDKNYINILIDRIEYRNKETKERIENIRKSANDYIDRNTN